ncbi:hypothetical protein ES703_32241 [subsurface metagenome]
MVKSLSEAKKILSLYQMGCWSVPGKVVNLFDSSFSRSYSHTSWAIPPLYLFQVRNSLAIGMYAIFFPSGENVPPPASGI